ncbi:MAG: NAD-dependent epimerase/dehydratase family protein [Actinomycetota bacterium]
MRAFVTGGTGFIGGHLARALRERGDQVVALVRSPARAEELREMGCELCEGSLSATDSLTDGVRGADAVFHVAAMYKVGIPRSERPAMYEANVRGTERVIDAAVEARVLRIVHVSTIGAFGNTHGKVVDETYRHPGDGYLSAYEETKVLAHRVAEDRIAKGAPVIIVQPGGVYGPGDSSDLGNLMDRIRRGKLPFKLFPESGFNFVHVDDIAQGILLAHDKGRIGESYVIGGQIATMGEMIEAISRASGRRPPRRTLPGWVVKAGVPFGPIVGRLMGVGPNLAESIRSADGVTYWATDRKAREELGYVPRNLETGLRESFAT